MESKEYTKYSSTIKGVYVRLMLLILTHNVLGLLSVDIVNTLFTAECAENIWYFCVAEFGTSCDVVVLLKQDLYGLETASQ